MPERVKGKCIWVLDRNAYWRNLISNALKKEGATVVSLSKYDVYLRKSKSTQARPDMAILSCLRLQNSELEVLNQTDLPVLVLAGSFSLGEMREFFRSGFLDIELRPELPDDLINAVSSHLAAMEQKKKYQSVYAQVP